MSEYEKMLPWERLAVCCHCCKPLADNQMVKDAFKANIVTAWAKGQRTWVMAKRPDCPLDLSGLMRQLGAGGER